MSSTTPDHGDYEEECSLAAKLAAQQHFAASVGECLILEPRSVGMAKKTKKKIAEFSDLVGRIITAIDHDRDRLRMSLSDGTIVELYHEQDCCESVTIDTIAGSLEDLVGSPITVATEETSNENPPGVAKEWQDSFTWTTYTLATEKCAVVIRWYGESNGYYSEHVNMRVVPAA